ncbi:Growth arrest and DNA damage-inducible proteins-interacting protein 1 [Varanus komodoensis]|nr:growth arrest and DNA damage-inducible proteins-interacting protein 1 [Varanus komodoensis]KAF7240055.1 Growth arrest and DNA damage-inducible proteins-interacting protein 1 [Varanus komodoensis]
MAAFKALGKRRSYSKMAACGSLQLLGGIRFYNARALRRQLGKMYLPDPADPRTPPFQLTAAYKAKLFGRYGAASGVNAAQLWPTPEQLQKIEAEEKTWYPPLREMEMALDAKEQAAEAKRRQREEHIAAKMAKMPQMIFEWQQEKELRRAKENEEKKRRELLLAEARERFGYNLDHRSAQFQEMMQEMEKARRKELKLQKKQHREEALAKKAMEKAAAAAAAAALTPEKEGEVIATEVLQEAT